MPGGLLNLVGAGQQNIILNGNPTKTFWKTSYSKYTNFGLQKFRLEYEGQKTINLTAPSQFTFKFKRYADLILDTYCYKFTSYMESIISYGEYYTR